MLASTRKNNANVYFFEPILPGGITPYEFEANYFVDISETIDLKIQSIREYKSQIEIYGEGWIKAIIGRGQLRGFQINSDHAEAFKIVKLRDI